MGNPRLGGNESNRFFLKSRRFLSPDESWTGRCWRRHGCRRAIGQARTKHKGQWGAFPVCHKVFRSHPCHCCLSRARELVQMRPMDPTLELRLLQKTWPWVILYASILGRMNTHVPRILMFTKKIGGFDHHSHMCVKPLSAERHPTFRGCFVSRGLDSWRSSPSWRCRSSAARGRCAPSSALSPRTRRAERVVPGSWAIVGSRRWGRGGRGRGARRGRGGRGGGGGGRGGRGGGWGRKGAGMGRRGGWWENSCSIWEGLQRCVVVCVLAQIRGSQGNGKCLDTHMRDRLHVSSENPACCLPLTDLASRQELWRRLCKRRWAGSENRAISSSCSKALPACTEGLCGGVVWLR